MARFSFGMRPTMLRPPISPGITKELTASPIQQAGQQIKSSQFPGAKALGGVKLPKQPRVPGQPKGNPFKAMPFYGE